MSDPSKNVVTSDELKSLLKFIGGFNKWPLLNEDCQKEVLKFLDYKDRLNLGICSKSDYKMMNSVPIEVHSIEVRDNECGHYSFDNEDFENVIVRVEFSSSNKSRKTYELVFSQIDEDAQMRWLKYSRGQRPEKQSLVLKCGNYYDEAVKFVERWMKRCNYKIRELRVEMSRYPLDTSEIKSLPLCKDVRIGADSLETLRWWFDKFPEDVSDIQIITLDSDRETFTLPRDFLDQSKILNTSKFYFWCRADFSDEQFLKLKASKMSFDCVNITDEGINQFLKNWIEGKGNQDFAQALLWSSKTRDEATLIRGISVRRWDQAFEEEAAGFCGDFERVCGRGTCFQISSLVDPYYSLTLCISDDSVSIYASGRKVTHDGRTYTDYGVP